MVLNGNFQSHPSAVVTLVTTKLLSTSPLVYLYINGTTLCDDLTCFNLVNATVSRLEGRENLEETEIGVGEDPTCTKFFPHICFSLSVNGTESKKISVPGLATNFLNRELMDWWDGTEVPKSGQSRTGGEDQDGLVLFRG